MALTTQYVKLSIDGTIYCIKDFPEVDPAGNPDQVEITTLCDEYHQYIDGLKTLPETLEFTANYDEEIFNTINSIGTTPKEVVILLCSGSEDTTGANGKFTISSAQVGVKLNGAGVGDVLEMVFVIKPKSAITFATVS